MTLVTPKRIKHLARYFCLAGILFLFGYRYTDYAHYFLALLGPIFFLAYWLRLHGGFLTQALPNEAPFNSLLLFLLTVSYFGLVGFQTKNILNERGKFRVFFFLAFVGFLVYIHYLAFQELGLYWAGTEKPVS